MENHFKQELDMKQKRKKELLGRHLPLNYILIYRHWRIKLFYVQKCQTEINQFEVFDDQ